MNSNNTKSGLPASHGGAILTLSIVSIFFLGFLLGPMAWYLGARDLRRMRKGMLDNATRTATKAGAIIGFIVTCSMFFIIMTAVILPLARGPAVTANPVSAPSVSSFFTP